jgi:hypothetical protein
MVSKALLFVLSSFLFSMNLIGQEKSIELLGQRFQLKSESDFLEAETFFVKRSQSHEAILVNELTGRPPIDGLFGEFSRGLVELEKEFLSGKSKEDLLKCVGSQSNNLSLGSAWRLATLGLGVPAEFGLDKDRQILQKAWFLGVVQCRFGFPIPEEWTKIVLANNDQRLKIAKPGPFSREFDIVQRSLTVRMELYKSKIFKSKIEGGKLKVIWESELPELGGAIARTGDNITEEDYYYSADCILVENNLHVFGFGQETFFIAIYDWRTGWPIGSHSFSIGR